MEECKCKPAKSYAERIIEYREFVSLVRKMREAQEEWEADLDDYDEHWGKSWEKEKLEKKVDELLMQMEV